MDINTESLTTAPTAAEGVIAGTDAALVNAGVAEGGTLMYAVTTTDEAPVDGFSATVPTAAELSAATYYVWYYIQGDAEHGNSEVAGPVEVTVGTITYYVVGTMNPDWNINTAYQLQPNTEVDGEYYIHDMALIAGTQLKVVSSLNGTDIKDWFPGEGGNYVVNHTATYSIYFRPDYSGGDDWHNKCIYAQITAVTLSKEDDNTAVLSELDGKTADITLTRTLKTGGWNTFAVPFNVDAATLGALKMMKGVTVKTLASSTLSGETLTLNFDDATSIEAGKPYLVKVSDNFDLSNNAFKDAVISKEAVAIQTTYADFVPTLGKTTINGSNAKEMLFLGAANTLYNPTSLPTYMKGFRAYFLLKGADSARSFVLNLGDETTSIEYSTLNNDRSSETIFDLQGRKVENATKKGVYIVNGKKVIK